MCVSPPCRRIGSAHLISPSAPLDLLKAISCLDTSGGFTRRICDRRKHLWPRCTPWRWAGLGRDGWIRCRRKANPRRRRLQLPLRPPRPPRLRATGRPRGRPPALQRRRKPGPQRRRPRSGLRRSLLARRRQRSGPRSGPRRSPPGVRPPRSGQRSVRHAALRGRRAVVAADSVFWSLSAPLRRGALCLPARTPACIARVACPASIDFILSSR